MPRRLSAEVSEAVASLEVAEEGENDSEYAKGLHQQLTPGLLM